MIKLRCLRATGHESNLHICCYIHILLQKCYIDFENGILYAIFIHAYSF